ncbi:MAG: hypothetical protein KIS92_20130 [Planctomycetota bacterium]|nr:hypothetical protein [Planctomycetota bacterium]
MRFYWQETSEGSFRLRFFFRQGSSWQDAGELTCNADQLKHWRRVCDHKPEGATDA